MDYLEKQVLEFRKSAKWVQKLLKKKRKLFMHEKTAAILFLIALLLMCISLCKGGCEEATAILQGISTGLFSGILLLLVNGRRNIEIGRLKEQYEIIHKCNTALGFVDKAYQTLLHETYHNKKEKLDFTEYMNLVKKAFDSYVTAFFEMSSIKSELITDDNIRNEFILYFDYLGKENNNLWQEIEKILTGDKLSLDRICGKLYDIQHKAYSLHFKIIEKEESLCINLVNINKSIC